MEFLKVKDKISFKLVNKEKNIYPLSDIPHTDYLDLTFVYFIVVAMNEAGVDTLMIENSDLEKWGISDIQLHKIAMKNFTALFALSMYSTCFLKEDKIAMITTKYKVFGAIYMADPDLIGCFADMFDDDICIIPSSVHEIIVIPASMAEKEEIDAIIKSVNKEAVDEDEYLSDHMYLFSKITRSVTY